MDLTLGIVLRKQEQVCNPKKRSTLTLILTLVNAQL